MYVCLCVERMGNSIIGMLNLNPPMTYMISYLFDAAAPESPFAPFHSVPERLRIDFTLGVCSLGPRSPAIWWRAKWPKQLRNHQMPLWDGRSDNRVIVVVEHCRDGDNRYGLAGGNFPTAYSL